jgi:hypothetical protein
MRRSDSLSVVLLSLAACAAPTGDEPTVPEDRPAVVYHEDGKVETNGLRFASVSAFHRSAEFRNSGRRCGTREPSRLLRAAPGDCDTAATMIKEEYAPGVTFTIPVVFHIIKKTDGTGEISDAMIQTQIDILNEDFGALANTPGAGGTPGRIRFVLATKNANGQPTTGINRVTNNSYFDDNGGMQMALHWDTTRYLNIYTSSAGGALGYATLASESAGQDDDGVVLLHSTVGRNPPMGGEYNMGRTGTHEVGHFLGLLHTFDGGCGTATAPYTSGDLIADTVAHATEDYECTAGATTCAGGGQKPIDNYMNYTPDACMTKFTVEQVNRMRCSIVNYRAQLVANDQGVGKPPIAGFSSTVDGLLARFMDESSDPDGTIALHSWMFGDGTTSLEQHPMHTYAAAGTYTVTLVVTDNSGASEMFSAPVTVADKPAGCTGDDCPDGGEEGGGCCQTGGGSSGGPLGLAGVVVALWFARARRSSTRRRARGSTALAAPPARSRG